MCAHSFQNASYIELIIWKQQCKYYMGESVDFPVAHSAPASLAWKFLGAVEYIVGCKMSETNKRDATLFRASSSKESLELSIKFENVFSVGVVNNYGKAVNICKKYHINNI